MYTIKYEYIFQESHDAIRAGIKAANNLPTGENYDYYAFFQSFINAKDKDVKRILATIQTIMKLAGSPRNIEHLDTEEKFELLLETNDLLLDQAVSIPILLIPMLNRFPLVYLISEWMSIIVYLRTYGWTRRVVFCGTQRYS